MLDEKVKKQFGSWTAFCAKYGYDYKNFKRTLLANVDKVNKWIEPLGLEILIVLKKQKRVGKKNKNTCTTDD